jgi:hypothetical protein
MISRISLFDLLVVEVFEALVASGFDADFDDEEGPEEVHAIENEGHGQQVVIFEGNHGPVVLGGWPVHVDVGQEAEREHDDPHPDPDRSHYYVNHGVHPLRGVDRLHKKPTKSDQDVAGIVDDEDHRASGYLVAHCREED